MNSSEEPKVIISLDSARAIEYNEYTTPLEVVTKNILGIVEGNPSYFIEQTEFDEFAAHVMKLSVDSISHLDDNSRQENGTSIFSVDSISKSFQMMLLLKNEFKDTYLFEDSLKFNYRWIRAGYGQEAIITVNNDKIYFLRRISGRWKIYVWANIDFYGKDYKQFNDN